MNLFDLSAVLTLDTSQYEKGIQGARQSAQGFVKSTDGINGALGKAQHGFTVFKGVLSNVIGGGVNALANAITSNLGGAISRVDTLNNYSIVMKNLGHGAKESQKAIDELVEGIDGLPTTLDGIVSVQQQFAALGGKMEDATELTLALNNATLAGGQGQEKANSAMAQWYQMIAAGKPDMMSMRIINEAMPAQLDAIAKSVLGADANWQDLNATWQKDPELTEKVKKAILELNEEGLNGTAGFAQQAEDATKGIQTSMQNLQTAIKNGIANIIQEFGKDNIANIFGGLKEGVKSAFGEIVTFIQNVKEVGFGDAIVMEIEKARDVVWNAFVGLMDIDWKSVFSRAFSKLQGAFTKYFEIALGIDTLRTNIVQRFMEAGTEMITSFITAIIENGDSIIETAVTVLSNFQSGIANNLTSLVSTATRMVNKLVDYLSEHADEIVQAGVKMVVALAKGLVQNAPKVLASVAKLGNAIVKGVLKIAPKLPPLAIKMVVALAGALAKGAGKLLNAAKNLAHKAVDGIKNTFSNVADIGLNLVKGIGKGITNGVGWIKGQIKSFVGNVKSFLKSLFGISSPSKWARDVIGLNIDKGLALGIEQNADMVDDAMEDVMPDIENSGFSLTSTTPANGGVKITQPTFNLYNTIDGAEDPEEWADRFSTELQMRARMA